MKPEAQNLPDAERMIRDKIAELARRRGVDATGLHDDEVIPDAGVLDSAGVLELIIWFEMTFDLTIGESDLTLENFGTIAAMMDYLRRAQSVNG